MSGKVRTKAILLLLVLCAALAVSAQSKPQLGESFAKAGLKAVVVINNDPESERAKAAYDDAEAECDTTNPYELIMLTNIETFKIKRLGGPLPPSCSLELEDAFRQRASIDLPKSCK